MQHARSKRFKSLSFGALTDIIPRARKGAFICYICRDCLDVIEGLEVQGRAKKTLLSLVTRVPSGLMGRALAA